MSGGGVHKSGRNCELTALAGRLRARGAGEDEILRSLLVAPERQGLAECECRDIARSIGSKPAGRVVTYPASGWPSPVHELAERRAWTIEALRALDCEHEGNEVYFPMRDASGAVTGKRRRRADGQPFGEGRKVLTVKGGKNGIICPWPIPACDPVLLTEGEADAVAALTAGHAATVATPGAQPGQRVIETLQTLLGGRDVVLCPDPDAAGDGWREKMGAALIRAGCRVRFIPPLPDLDLDKRLGRIQ